MKSVYVDDDLHRKLKTLASMRGNSLTDTVARLLARALEADEADFTSKELAAMSTGGGAFDFLHDAAEDVYSPTDGEPVR